MLIVEWYWKIFDVERYLETEETKQEQKGSIKEDLSAYLYSKKDKTSNKIGGERKRMKLEKLMLKNIQKRKKLNKNKRIHGEDLSAYRYSKKDKTSNKIEEEKDLQKPLVTTLFYYLWWNYPLQYIKNDHFDNAVRSENSQFCPFCQSDWKEKISFTYPLDLSTFLKTMEKIGLFIIIRDQISYCSTNKEKKKLSNKFYKRAKVLDEEFLLVDVNNQWWWERCSSAAMGGGWLEPESHAPTCLILYENALAAHVFCFQRSILIPYSHWDT